jgi:hypothetical protein
MAKKKKKEVNKFSFQSYNLKHFRTTEQYVAAVNSLFDRATKAIANAAVKGEYDPDKPFSFDDYPDVKVYAQKIITGLANNVTSVVETGVKKEWLAACKKNDEFIASIMDTSKLSKKRLEQLQDRNLDALQTFQQRKIKGLDLSKRVWKYTEQYKAQIELGLDVGLGEGRSAQQLSRDLKQNLNNPDKLFRRVRDKRGNLVLSKAAKAFHPGQGVYRSAHKNAMRLARSEINMAYRESDYLRWQQLDFVVGFEVHRSNHEPLCKCDLCQRLTGRYPKTFKFVGWHPQCMCYATAILMDEKTFDEQELSDLKSALYGKEYKKLVPKNAVTDLPQGFKDWVAENMQKQANWTSTPYFIRDNFVNANLADGLKYVAPAKPIKPVKTEQQKADIQARWDERKALQSVQAEFGQIRDELAKWVSVYKIYEALNAKNPTLAKNLIESGKAEMRKLKVEYKADISDMHNTIREASNLGIDVSQMKAMLDNAESNNMYWIANKPLFKQAIQELKQRIANPDMQENLHEIIKLMDDAKIEYREVKELATKLTETEIIERLAGGDMTKGSCSSLAFAYAGNKCGFDVLDFRDGTSRLNFSRSTIINDIATHVGGTVVEHTSDFIKANKLLEQVKPGKEYYFTCGKHAAIVRKTASGGYEYLELQSSKSNGFKELNRSELKYRFGAQQSHRFHGKAYNTKDCIIDIDLLKKDATFRKLLGYINTQPDKQRKGEKGTIK